MIADLREWSGESPLSCDVCIVGAGAAGLTLAHALAGTRLRVVVVESGGMTLEPESQDLSKGVSSGARYTGHFEGRARAIGGTTNLWGGQILPLEANDFERRPWISDSGWPFPKEVLAPHYSRAAEILNLDADDFGAGLAHSLGAALPRFEPTELHSFFSKWLREPNLWRVLGERVRQAPNVTIVLHANATIMRLDDNARIATVACQSLDGKHLTVNPRCVVLAVGALESARLLLANRMDRPNGLGNEQDLVGRYLQDHPGGGLGLVHPHDDRATQSAFNVYLRRGLRYTVRFALSPELQAKEQVTNASGSLMFFPHADSGFVAAKALYRSIANRALTSASFAHFTKAVADLPTVARSAVQFLRGRVYTPAPVVRLMGSFEQEPNRESRVTLSSTADALGVPRLDIHWRLTELTHRTVRVFAETAKRQLEALGVGRVSLEPWITDTSDAWRGKVGDHYHQIGTARMHQSPREGVVDPDCRVHSVPNLYVASSAVFPTGGHSNPTFTIIALAIRLAGHLKTELAQR
jgi:choline dehydrogenase-like flavoprotein